MRALVIIYLLVVVVGIVAVAVVPLPPPPTTCNFCSGSGVGNDCPRNDRAARRACREYVKRNFQ
jgi:hypothetical protein